MKTLSKLLKPLALLLFAMPVFALAQNDTAKINFIKAQYADINGHLKSYKKVVKEDTVETTEGNEVLLYFNGNEIKKIQATYYGENGKAVDEYYFSDRKLIFYYSIGSLYNVPIYANNGHVKVVSKIEKRYYFYADELFLVKLNPKAPIFPKEYKRLSAYTKAEARRLMNLKQPE